MKIKALIILLVISICVYLYAQEKPKREMKKTGSKEIKGDLYKLKMKYKEQKIAMDSIADTTKRKKK